MQIGMLILAVAVFIVGFIVGEKGQKLNSAGLWLLSLATASMVGVILIYLFELKTNTKSSWFDGEFLIRYIAITAGIGAMTRAFSGHEH